MSDFENVNAQADYDKQLQVEVDSLGFLVTMEHVAMIRLGQSIEDTKAHMQELLTEALQKRYDMGMEAGLQLGKVVSD